MKRLRNLKLALFALVMALPVFAFAQGSGVDVKILKAIDAADEGDYFKSKFLCDQVVSKHWDDLDLYNKANLAICYMTFLDVDGMDEDEVLDNLLRCWNSAKADDEAALKEYIDYATEEEGIYEAVEAILKFAEVGKSSGWF